MTYIAKPKVHHPSLQKNDIGLTRRDYEGAITTLCAGCGHDSITAAVIQAFWELSIAPHKVAKLSGIGCSSKTPAYFLRDAHGFNGVHGRMPALATGANAANGDIIYIGVSGDGDSLSIGLGQLSHAIRRNVNMLYLLENNGVYGLTKGQFSASADPGSTSKKGEANTMEAIDSVLLALTLGCTFVARSFSGDKGQLVPILKAGLAHRGFAFIDIISPCVTFNDHEGSTKSYAYTREHDVEVVQADFVPPREEIAVDYEQGEVKNVMLHDGGWVRLRKIAKDYDATDRDRAYAYIRERQGAGEIATGLLYISSDSRDLHDQSETVEQPLTTMPYEKLCPGSAELTKLQQRFRSGSQVRRLRRLQVRPLRGLQVGRRSAASSVLNWRKKRGRTAEPLQRGKAARTRSRRRRRTREPTWYDSAEMRDPGASPARLLVALAILASACSTPPSPSPPAPAIVTPKNLLLVTIDTLRADRVGSYGYAAAKTPAMDDLARRGVRFERAFAAAPITLTSHASLMTGRNPPGHGARHNGIRLRDDVPTLATILAGAGFATGAFVSAFPLDRRFGLARGFAAYDDHLPREDDGRAANERAGALTVDAAQAWLAGHRASPFFLWVHLFEPHAPYGRGAASATSTVAVRYDEEIAEADRQLARVIEGLADARPSTLIVVAADHGEAFGEHGEIAHSIFAYDTTLRVPLILSGAGVPADGRVVKSPAGLIDVAPTVLALLGQPAIASDGVDLRAAVDGKPAGARALYAESFAPLVDFGWSPLRSIRDGRWKYIAAPRAELYDLDADPEETRNVLPDQAATAAALAARVDAVSPASLETTGRDRDATQRLGSLGYVSLPNRSSPHDAARLDPKDRIALASRLAEVTSGEVPAERLVATLEALLRDDPDNPYVELRLGVALADRGECDAAERHLRSSIQAGVPSADPFLSLAYCYKQRGAAAAAERALTSADRAEPGNPVVAANLGLVAFDAGRMKDAIAHLDRAVTRDPDLHMARFFLARAYARTGNREAAHEQAVALLSRLPASAPQRAEVERLEAAVR